MNYKDDLTDITFTSHRYTITRPNVLVLLTHVREEVDSFVRSQKLNLIALFRASRASLIGPNKNLMSLPCINNLKLYRIGTKLEVTCEVIAGQTQFRYRCDDTQAGASHRACKYMK